ncbi:hypothetical protein [Cellulosimicrobium composti]|uniref:Uncharacterized protein n=1 Tax=Cellulosimicrobium composti TaxID=2672572 RepID=A0ABX0BKC7_9MICO|nr:hypothetical protein [Cellulosimicrobium composti]NDO91466.1 hypothetical protein [Cellulosimicrobium composti]
MEDVRPHTTRQAGAALTTLESALLERICAGSWRGSEEARAQLVHARWGGKDHDGDACFLIHVLAGADVPRIPSHAGGPIATLAVADGDEHLGWLELWVDDGRLHSLDYSTFSDTAGETLPGVHLLDGITAHDGMEQSR